VGASLKKYAWLASTKLEDTKIRIIVKDVETARKALMSLLPESGLLVRRFESVTPSLEDIFVKVVNSQGGANDLLGCPAEKRFWNNSGRKSRWLW